MRHHRRQLQSRQPSLQRQAPPLPHSQATRCGLASPMRCTRTTGMRRVMPSTPSRKLSGCVNIGLTETHL